MRVGYLGPPGTFTEEALSRCDLATGAERVAFPSIAEAIEAVGSRQVEMSMVPIENSLEGSVNVTLDMLVQRPGLRIRREVLLPVRQNLLARPGVVIDDIKRVVSIPIALAQCQVFLRARLPGVPLDSAPSTAEAARDASQRPDTAAVGSRIAAERYGLALLAEDIHDEEGNTTRFVLIGGEDEKATGRDRTSIAFTLDRDRPGGLYEVLGEFAKRQMNLSKIESRPNKRALGHYVFFVDFEGHRADADGTEALAGVLERVHALHLLGSYPRG
ncbi:MAG TPA: prephenate dehydratase [Anaeromyxobacteraceae bacterium]|nr:prephenate dehydratase [Anaeromyxobacteraceae bacterium]